jgi:branched-chain amino acid transport system permease protein
MKKSLLGSAALLLLGVVLTVLPLSYYLNSVLRMACLNAIAAMGVSFLTGFTGVFTLGHAAYMAIGAYTSAILTVNYHLHWFPAIIAGGVVSILVAWLVGVPTLRLTGDYYAIASLGLCEAIRLVLENWQSVTRGARGFGGIAPFSTRPVIIWFFVVLAIIMFNLVNSRVGRECRACRDDPVATALMGYNTHSLRIMSLLISAFYCGISGGLLAGYMSFVQPSAFSMLKSTELTAVVFFGGMGSMSGTLIGSFTISALMEYFRDVSQYRMLIYGLILVLVMVLRPEGIMGSREIWMLFRRKTFDDTEEEGGAS